MRPPYFAQTLLQWTSSRPARAPPPYTRPRRSQSSPVPRVRRLPGSRAESAAPTAHRHSFKRKGTEGPKAPPKPVVQVLDSSGVDVTPRSLVDRSGDPRLAPCRSLPHAAGARPSTTAALTTTSRLLLPETFDQRLSLSVCMSDCVSPSRSVVNDGFAPPFATSAGCV